MSESVARHTQAYWPYSLPWDLRLRLSTVCGHVEEPERGAVSPPASSDDVVRARRTHQVRAGLAAGNVVLVLWRPAVALEPAVDPRTAVVQLEDLALALVRVGAIARQARLDRAGQRVAVWERDGGGLLEGSARRAGRAK